MKVKAIRPAGYEDVFNMEVDQTHNFAVGSGIIVHNCYDELRYVCMKNPIAARQPRTAKPVVYDPLSTGESTPNYDRYEFYRRY